MTKFKVGDIVEGIMPVNKQIYMYSSVGIIAQITSIYNNEMTIRILESPWKDEFAENGLVRQERFKLHNQQSKEDKLKHHKNRVENRHLLKKNTGFKVGH